MNIMATLPGNVVNPPTSPFLLLPQTWSLHTDLTLALYDPVYPQLSPVSSLPLALFDPYWSVLKHDFTLLNQMWIFNCNSDSIALQVKCTGTENRKHKQKKRRYNKFQQILIIIQWSLWMLAIVPAGVVKNRLWNYKYLRSLKNNTQT